MKLSVTARKKNSVCLLFGWETTHIVGVVFGICFTCHKYNFGINDNIRHGYEITVNMPARTIVI